MPKNSNRPRKGETRGTIDQTTSNAPYAEAKPGIDSLLGLANSGLAGGPLPSFPGSTYAGLGTGTQDALAATRTAAGQPSAASTYLTDMAAGGQQNPFLSQLLDQGSTRIADRVKAAYASKGRYGSEDFTEGLARGISEFQTPLLYSAYEGDQGRKLAAAGQIDNQRFAGADRLLMAGGLEDADAQAQRDADVARFQWENGGGQRDLLSYYANLLGGLGGAFGSSTTQGTNTSYERPTPFLNILQALAGIGGAVGGFKKPQVPV